MKTWREHFTPLIASVIDSVGTGDVKEIRKALRKAYPCGERRYWPYKVWCDEVRRQLGLKHGPKMKPDNPRQMKLF